MSEREDIKHIEQYLNGDSAAFELLIDKYQKKIFKLAFRIVNDYNDAEDITQSVFIKAYEKLDTFDPKHKFFSWLYRIAINESLNFLDKKKHYEGIDQNMVSKERTPEETFYNIELNRNIQDALMNLKSDYRVVMILKHLNNLSYSEISQVLKIPEKTVKSRLFSARQLVKNILLKKGVNIND